MTFYFKIILDLIEEIVGCTPPSGRHESLGKRHSTNRRNTTRVRCTIWSPPSIRVFCVFSTARTSPAIRVHVYVNISVPGSNRDFFFFRIPVRLTAGDDKSIDGHGRRRGGGTRLFGRVAHAHACIYTNEQTPDGRREWHFRFSLPRTKHILYVHVVYITNKLYAVSHSGFFFRYRRPRHKLRKVHLKPWMARRPDQTRHGKCLGNAVLVGFTQHRYRHRHNINGLRVRYYQSSHHMGHSPLKW